MVTKSGLIAKDVRTYTVLKSFNTQGLGEVIFRVDGALIPERLRKLIWKDDEFCVGTGAVYEHVDGRYQIVRVFGRTNNLYKSLNGAKWVYVRRLDAAAKQPRGDVKWPPVPFKWCDLKV